MLTKNILNKMMCSYS